MAENKGIPPDLVPEVLARAGAGQTTRQIAEWLRTAHQLSANHATVARLLKATRDERADVAKVVVREKLTATVGTDIDRLEKHAARLDEIADQLAEGGLEGGIKAYLGAIEQLRKLTDTKLHYSGADAPDDSLAELSDIAKRVTGRVARLAAARRARAVPEGTGADDPGAGGP